jgi:cytochrome b-561
MPTLERTYSFDEEAPPGDANSPQFIYSRSISAAVYLAHRLSIVAIILVVLWALFTNTSEDYLGGLDWNYPHVFNWHPILMVCGMVICTTEGLLAFRAFPFDKVINRRVRYIWHTAGICFMVVGLVAVFEYNNDRNKANLWSIHSWLGIITITLYLTQYILGIYLFFYEGADIDMREAYIPFFAWLDIIVYVSACFTAEMGIVEKNTELGCTYNTTEISNYNNADPSIYYSDLPSGCRVSSGLGIVILFLCLCTVYAALELKLPDLSNTAAGWEAYKLTEEEQRRRGTWADYFWSFWPFGRRKRRRNQESVGGGGVVRGKGGGRKKGNNWIEKNDGNGVYYYNTKTNESTKVRPMDF